MKLRRRTRHKLIAVGLVLMVVFGVMGAGVDAGYGKWKGIICRMWPSACD